MSVSVDKSVLRASIATSYFPVASSFHSVAVILDLQVMAAATNTETQETPEYRTFRQNYGTLYNAIQDPLTLATRLFADNIITSAVKEEMSAMGRTRLDKNEALLNAVGTKIRIDPSKLDVFLSTLDEDPPMQSLVENMRGKKCCAILKTNTMLSLH